MFKNRFEAGLLLADKLNQFANEDSIVLAIPRGGVPVGYAVAQKIKAPLEVILAKKIGHPDNKEYAIGAASMYDFFVVPHDNVSQEYIISELKRIRERLAEMHQLFNQGKAPIDLKDKTVIIIDDGIATGNTLLGTINLIRKTKPAKIIIGAPVASKSSIDMLKPFVDKIVTVLIPFDFHGVGQFYEDFSEVNDNEVLYYLKRLKETASA